MKTALITGASGGIGYELARLHAAAGHRVILVSRNGDKLQKISEELQVNHRSSVHFIVKDLSRSGAAAEVFEEVQRCGLSIDYLINNAGIGSYGLFHEIDWMETEGMINLNVMTLTQLARLYLPLMIQRKSGRILNIASTASFQPGPTMAAYFACKAYVLHLSEAIAEELRGTGVTVTALCPGPTESNFKDRARMQQSRLFRNRRLPSAREVAEYGYRAMMRGDRVAIHGKLNYLLANSVRFVPRKLATKIARWMMAGT